MKSAHVSFHNMLSNTTLADLARSHCDTLDGFFTEEAAIYVTFEKSLHANSSSTAVKVSCRGTVPSFDAEASSFDPGIALSAAMSKASALARSRSPGK